MCDHAAWAQTSGIASRLCITDTNRLATLNRKLTNPSNQYPSVLFCIGKQTKTTALRELFPDNTFNRRSRDEAALAKIHVDNTTTFSKYLIFFGEGSTEDPSPQDQSTAPCHETRCYSISWSNSRTLGLDLALSRLFFLFTDLICIFADDFQNLQEVIDLIVRWVEHGSASSLHPQIRPRIIIVLSVDSAHVARSRSRNVHPEKLDLGSKAKNSRDVFHSMHIVRLSRKDLSTRAQFLSLKQHILRVLDEARQQRIQQDTLFQRLTSLVSSG